MIRNTDIGIFSSHGQKGVGRLVPGEGEGGDFAQGIVEGRIIGSNGFHV